MAGRTLTVWELQYAGRAKPQWTLSGNADVRGSSVSLLCTLPGRDRENTVSVDRGLQIHFSEQAILQTWTHTSGVETDGVMTNPPINKALMISPSLPMRSKSHKELGDKALRCTQQEAAFSFLTVVSVDGTPRVDAQPPT